MERRSYVYKITCKITGEYYFGSSFYIMRNSYFGGGTKIRERVAQYGKENFVKEILGEFDDRTIAHQVENKYIEKFRHDDKCLNRQLDHKFETYSYKSRAKIGDAERGEKNHNFGKHISEEAKAKLSAAHIGKHLSEETRAKMSAVHLGKKSPMFGKHLSEETKQKIREYRRGRTPWNKGKKLNKETGKYE